MLKPEEVDEGYFTPLSSTSLANIFRDNSSNDETVNASLKYKSPQPKKTDQSAKPDDPNATQCVFSCSLIAYEWIEGARKYKRKVGFAVIQTLNTEVSKMILYSPDKSTLSCTTLSPQLEVNIKGPMISLFDDHKKYWGLCFNDKNIEDVKKLLLKENVVINHFESPHSDNVPLKPEVKSLTNEDTTENIDKSDEIEEKVPTWNNDRASILSRIANVGHAILPSIPASPVKKSTSPFKLNPTEAVSSTEQLNMLSDANDVSAPHPHTTIVQDLTRSVAVQAGTTSIDNNAIASHNSKHVSDQNLIPRLPLINNQVFTYVNGCMVPVHMHIPMIDDAGGMSIEIDHIIQKLTRLQSLVQDLEIFEINEKLQNNKKQKNKRKCTCKNDDNEHSETVLASDNVQSQNDQYYSKISNLEQLISEKDDAISKLQCQLHSESKKTYDVINNSLKKEIEDLKQNLMIKDHELENMIPRSEASGLIASTVKKLMNDTFRSLSSNFENEVTYSGNNIKAILAAVIKKCTVESLTL